MDANKIVVTNSESDSDSESIEYVLGPEPPKKPVIPLDAQRKWSDESISVQLCTLGVVLIHVSRPYRHVDKITKYVRVVGQSQDVPRWGLIDNDEINESLKKLKTGGFVTDTGDSETLHGWQLTQSGIDCYKNVRKRYSKYDIDVHI